MISGPLKRLMSIPDPLHLPWPIRILGGKGYKYGYVTAENANHPSADEQEYKNQVEALFPEANIYFVDSRINPGDDVEQAWSPEGKLHAEYKKWVAELEKNPDLR